MQAEIKTKQRGTEEGVTHSAVRVLEDLSSLLVAAHFLHANLLQAWRVTAANVPLLTGDHRARLLLVQEH